MLEVWIVSSTPSQVGQIRGVVQSIGRPPHKYNSQIPDKSVK